MNPHEWYIEHRTAFVARSLDREDEKVFIDHLVRCDECTREVARLEDELAWLPMGVEPVAPPPGLSWRLAERVLGLGAHRWKRWAAAAGIAASLVLAAGLWFSGRQVARELAAKLDIREAQLAAVQDTLMIIRRAERVLQASIEMNGHKGGLMIFADGATHRWNVVVHGLPAAHAGEVYQFWFICEDGMVRGAELELDPARPAFLTMAMPEEGGRVMGAALTMEPAAEKSPEPRGRELAHLML